MYKKNFISSSPRICIQHVGKGELIIFLHGIGGNKNNWNDNLDYFSKDYHAIAWDTRGYGESDDYDGDLIFDDILEDLKKIILYFKKPFANIVGLSMGGQIACLFYEKYPQFVKSLVLCDTHFGLGKLHPKEIEKFVKSRKEPLLNGLNPQDISEKVAKSLIGNKSNKVALNKLIESISILHKNSYLKTIEASFKTSHDHIFKNINVPTLILVGELDTLTPPKMAKKIKKAIKNSQFFVIDKAGHLTNIERPKIFNEIVFNFLKNLT